MYVVSRGSARVIEACRLKRLTSVGFIVGLPVGSSVGTSVGDYPSEQKCQNAATHWLRGHCKTHQRRGYGWILHIHTVEMNRKRDST